MLESDLGFRKITVGSNVGGEGTGDHLRDPPVCSLL